MSLPCLPGLERVDVRDGNLVPRQNIADGSDHLDQTWSSTTVGVDPVKAVIGVGATGVVEPGDGGGRGGEGCVPEGVIWVFDWVLGRGRGRGRGVRGRRRGNVESVGGYDAVGQGYSRETTGSGIDVGLHGGEVEEG